LALDSNYGKIEPGERNDPIKDDKYGMRDDMYINVFSFLWQGEKKILGEGGGESGGSIEFCWEYKRIQS